MTMPGHPDLTDHTTYSPTPPAVCSCNAPIHEGSYWIQTAPGTPTIQINATNNGMAPRRGPFGMSPRARAREGWLGRMLTRMRKWFT